jgi:hypothetical protein
MLLTEAGDGNVVRLTAGEVVQRRAVAVLGDHPEIDLQAGLKITVERDGPAASTSRTSS